MYRAGAPPRADPPPGYPLRLPAQRITVDRRADELGDDVPVGTSQLSKASAEWKSKIGSSTAVAWSGGVGAKGREGVAAYLQRIEASIEAPQVGEPAVEAKEEVVVGADMFR